MDKDNSKNKRVIVIAISIIILLALVLAISYAYFRTELNGKEQIVKVGELELVLNETSEGISLDNSTGLSDSKGMSLTPSTFELINNENKAVDYTIYLDDNTISDTDTRIDDKYLKYNLNKNGADSGPTLLTRIGTNPNRILDSGTIEGGETNTYSLNLWITGDVDGNYSGQVFSGKLRVEVSQERPLAVDTILAKANPEDLDYNSATNEQQKEMWTFTHPATEQTEALTDYRYIGSNPNNYVTFNDELWRIIGVFTVDDGTGNMEQRLKLIRMQTTGSVTFGPTSDWTSSPLMENLNSGDYWTNNLNSEAKNMIGDTLWYLGGTSSYQSSTTGLASHFYSYERGTTVYNGRSTNWVGNVGLMYPSDYGYATSGDTIMDRNSCLNVHLTDWSGRGSIPGADHCLVNDWLSISSTTTITPYIIRPDYVFRLSGTSVLQYILTTNNFFVINPVVYLTSSVKIIDGDGSSSNPYIFRKF